MDSPWLDHCTRDSSPRPFSNVACGRTRYHSSVSTSSFSILSNPAPLDHERFSAHRELESLLKKSLRGEVRFDLSSRALYAADASNLPPVAHRRGFPARRRRRGGRTGGLPRHRRCRSAPRLRTAGGYPRCIPLPGLCMPHARKPLSSARRKLITGSSNVVKPLPVAIN